MKKKKVVTEHVIAKDFENLLDFLDSLAESIEEEQCDCCDDFEEMYDEDELEECLAELEPETIIEEDNVLVTIPANDLFRLLTIAVEAQKKYIDVLEAELDMDSLFEV